MPEFPKGGATVKNIQIGDFVVVADFVSRSGKSAWQYRFKFDELTGNYEWGGAFGSAKEPQFFGDAVRAGIKRLTGC